MARHRRRELALVECAASNPCPAPRNARRVTTVLRANRRPPSTSFLPSPASNLFGEHHDERVRFDFASNLLGGASRQLSQLLRQLPRGVVSGFGRNVFDGSTGVLQKRVRTQQTG